MSTETEMTTARPMTARERAAEILYGNNLTKKLPSRRQEDATVVAELQVPVKDLQLNKYVEHPTDNKSLYEVTGDQEFRSYVVPNELTEDSLEEQAREVPHMQLQEYVSPGVARAEKRRVDLNRESPLEQDLDKDTAYVVRFKAPTLVVAASVAVTFVLLTVLLIVNIVSLSSSGAGLDALRGEQGYISEQLSSARQDANLAREEALNQINYDSYSSIPSGNITTRAAESARPTTNGQQESFFTKICKFFSNLFG